MTRSWRRKGAEGDVMLPLAMRASAVLAPAVVAVALLAAAGRASVDGPSTAGGPALSNDAPSGLPLFDVRDASPAVRGVERCIVLRNAGIRPGHVTARLRVPPDGGLASYIRMTVERGAQPWGAPGAGCRGFRRARRNGTFFRGSLRAFPTRAEDAAADGGPALAPGRSRAYRISWWVSDSPNAQGGTVSGVDFVWDAGS